MKRMMIALSTIITVGLIFCFSGMTVYAGNYEDYVEKWLQKQRKQDEKYMDRLEADGNLTQEAIDSISHGTSTRKPNHKSSNKSKSSGSTFGSSSSTYNYSGSGKGWVYSVDELHVIGLPEGENGYTKPGWYGDID